jgi:hypothetical protein
MTYSFITPEIAEELELDLAPRVTVICKCGVMTHYYQDPPGNRCFDEVYCSGCGTVIGKT